MPPKSKRAKQSAKLYDQLASLKGAQLSKKLEEIYQALRKTTTEESFPGFSSLIEQLSQDYFLKSGNKNVAQLVSYCVVEVFRINEGIGFPDSSSANALRLIIHNLRALELPSKTELYQCSFEMFEKLYQTSLLKVMVSLSDEGEELTIELSRVIFSILESLSTSTSPKKKGKRKTPPKKAQGGNADSSSALTEEEMQTEREKAKRVSIEILISIIDLYKHVPEGLIDMLLMHLIEETEEGETSLSQEVVHDLLIAKKAKLASSIQKFCTSILCAETSEGSSYESSEHVIHRFSFHCQIYSILIHLSSLSSDYVLVLLPLVTRQLHIENDASRLEVVNCLSQIFSNADNDYINQFSFIEFVNTQKFRAVRGVLESLPGSFHRYSHCNGLCFFFLSHLRVGGARHRFGAEHHITDDSPLSARTHQGQSVGGPQSCRGLSVQHHQLLLRPSAR